MDSQVEQQLEKILPEDIARTFESAYHVFKGDHDHMEDLLKNGSTLLKKTAQRLSATQMVLSIAVLAGVALFFVKRAEDN